MAQAQRRLIPEDNARAARHGKYKLDGLDPSRIAKHLTMFQPSEKALVDVVARARLSIPGIAETEEVLRVVRYNPICVLALARKSKFDPLLPEAEGFVAILPLNRLGLQTLALGSFNATSPDLRLVARPDERPAGLYMWAVFAPGSLAAGIALFLEQMSRPQYTGVNLYSRPNTDAGRRYNEVLGLTQGVMIEGIHAPNIWKFSREAVAPLYDSYVPHSGKKDIGITVARNLDDLMRVAAVRDAVYIGEQQCPYDEEYDGNDLAATHLLAYIGDEPVGCLRLRFFGDFAKFERVAVRPEFRKSRAAIQLVKAGLKLCQKKGYRRVLGHAQTRLASFWTRFGFQPLEGRDRFVFSDYDYIEMVAELEPDPDAVTLHSDPYVMIRPEGRWHVPGILEYSAIRAVTNPSLKKKKI
jgi:predicted GNAT family N-acyltransferase